MEESKSWQGKSKSNRLGYMFFVKTLQLFGVTPAYILLVFVALYYCLFSMSSTKHMWRYFRQQQQYGRFKTILSIYRNYYLFGQTLIDKIVVMANMNNKFSWHFDGVENLHAIAAGGKGGLLLSAHMGNWEIAGHLLDHIAAAVNIVMYDGEVQAIKDYLNSVTGDRKVNVIVIKDDLSHIYAINNALQANELVCMHADRFMEGNKTMRATLLRNEACFPAGPFILAATFKVPVSFVFAFKETNRHYHLYASKGIVFEGSPIKQLAPEVLVQYVEAVNEKLQRYPLHWFNYYDFWKNTC